VPVLKKKIFGHKNNFIFRYGSAFALTLNMPEGPSILILKEAVSEFAGQKILAATGNAKIDKGILVNQKIKAFESFGKQFFILTKKATVRIHFLLFGSYSINENKKPERSLRLHLHFKKGDIYFYTCSVRLLESNIDSLYDWKADVMSDAWDPSAARVKLKEIPDTMVCDALLDQNIFAGVGNIIKNEVLYRIKIHPESLVGDLPGVKINALVKEARNYSFEFLEWKKAFVLKKHWLAHTKKICKRCNFPIIKQYCGKTHRRTFYCENCQVKF
jgi:endonuclease-8